MSENTNDKYDWSLPSDSNWESESNSNSSQPADISLESIEKLSEAYTTICQMNLNFSSCAESLGGISESDGVEISNIDLSGVLKAEGNISETISESLSVPLEGLKKTIDILESNFNETFDGTIDSKEEELLYEFSQSEYYSYSDFLAMYVLDHSNDTIGNYNLDDYQSVLLDYINTVEEAFKTGEANCKGALLYYYDYWNTENSNGYRYKDGGKVGYLEDELYNFTEAEKIEYLSQMTSKLADGEEFAFSENGLSYTKEDAEELCAYYIAQQQMHYYQDAYDTFYGKENSTLLYNESKDLLGLITDEDIITSDKYTNTSLKTNTFDETATLTSAYADIYNASTAATCGIIDIADSVIHTYGALAGWLGNTNFMMETANIDLSNRYCEYLLANDRVRELNSKGSEWLRIEDKDVGIDYGSGFKAIEELSEDAAIYYGGQLFGVLFPTASVSVAGANISGESMYYAVMRGMKTTSDKEEEYIAAGYNADEIAGAALAQGTIQFISTLGITDLTPGLQLENGIETSIVESVIAACQTATSEYLEYCCFNGEENYDTTLGEIVGDSLMSGIAYYGFQTIINDNQDSNFVQRYAAKTDAERDVLTDYVTGGVTGLVQDISQTIINVGENINSE